MSDNTYAAILAALSHGQTVTYGALTRGERMHVQSMRRDGLAVVLDASGGVLDSLDGDPASKRGWQIRVTERGRACADVLAPFATGTPVLGKPARAPRHAAPASTSSDSTACGQATRKGTPCPIPVGPSGACRVHGSPVVTSRVESAPAPVIESAPALDADALLAGLAALLAGAR